VALHSTIPAVTIECSWCPGKTPPSEGLQHTVSFIQTELRALNVRKEKLSERITTIKQIVIGLSQVFGPEVLNKQPLGVQSGESRGRRREHRGLTNYCRLLLRSRPSHAFTLEEIDGNIRHEHPALLAHHRYPTHSLRVIVKRLVAYGEAEEIFVDNDHLAWKAAPERKIDVDIASRSHKRRENPALSRACRIALLEHSEFMSENEIYSRIVRRGSFTFPNPRLAAVSLGYELNLLCEHRQARFIEIGNERRWQRVIPTEESEPSAVLTKRAPLTSNLFQQCDLYL
jgi:hypothetical protein